MGNSLFLIVKERNRQVSEEGWTAEHDDKWIMGELALAAIAYIYACFMPLEHVFKMYWPWEAHWWKPADRIRNLVKAGALIAAEIDRLERLEERKVDDG